MNYDSISKIGRPANKPEAELLANRLVERLEEKLGGDWKPRIWHNLRWCYDAFLVNGSMSVSEAIIQGQPPSYRASLNSNLTSHSGTNTIWADSTSYSTPEEAVIKQLNKAEEVVEKYRKAVQFNKNLLSKTNKL